MPEPLNPAAEVSAHATRKNAAGRLLAVLDAFGPRSRALSLSEISRQSGLSLSTTHRLVHELLSWGALERDPNGRYSIGVRLLELAALAPRGLDLREAAFPCLDELHHRTRGNLVCHAFGITLIGFVRGDSFNIYAHPERITA